MRWVTLFLSAKNENLMKDVGLIPYFMHKIYNIDANIVSYDNGDYTYLNKEVKGLKHIIVPNRGRMLTSIKYLIKESKKIDILNLYHWGRYTYMCSYLYKKLNKNGKLYVKLDMDMKGINVIKESKRDQKILKKIINKADIVTVESKRIYNELKKYYKNDNLYYIPNGLYDSKVQVGKKKKQILTVGRLGTQQKATEILLEAFEKIEKKIPEWKLILIGGVEKDFEEYIEKYYKKFPAMKNRVIFKGHISDKNSLKKYYSESKIFALPSRWEGFALVLLEAMSQGCYLVTTDSVSPVYDLICDESMGLIALTNDVEDFSKKLLQACCDDDINSKYISETITRQYDWNVICKKLANKIEIFGE